MTRIIMVEVNDDNRKDLVRLALSMYLDEICPYCLVKFATLDDLKEAVWNGYTEYGRIAHKSCFNLAHPDYQEQASA